MTDQTQAAMLYLEPDQLRRVNGEFVRYIRSSFPMRFYRSEPWWFRYCAAALLRMCDSVESLMLLLSRRKDLDAVVLLRTFYEQVVVFAWTAIDPPRRYVRWADHGNRRTLAMHNECLHYGQVLLSPDELAFCEKAGEGIPSVEVMARELDAFWPSEIPGLQLPKHVFSFHGLYQSVYRVGSNRTHGSMASLETYMMAESYPSSVAQREPGSMFLYSLAAPLLGIALTIGARHFRWIDEVRVRRFVDRATAETARRRQAVGVKRKSERSKDL
jgi:hypothetical protein